MGSEEGKVVSVWPMMITGVGPPHSNEIDCPSSPHSCGEGQTELLAPAVAKREEVMQNVLDSARARIATRRVVKEKALARRARVVEDSMES